MAGSISLPRFVGCLIFLVIGLRAYVSISLHMFIRPLKKLWCRGRATFMGAANAHNIMFICRYLAAVAVSIHAASSCAPIRAVSISAV